ncbi:MAG: FxsA family protein [Gammaproteobacteria bacterium]|nr:FxsA family protein [Gammaproteobacteria bacterium]MCP5137997.1 FxsA family protein [Gammaproteobacteria bacterium]
MPVFLLLFIGIPLLEIYLFIHVGGALGALNTMALVVITAVLGVWLLRLQGMATWFRVQQQLAQGKPPAKEMIEGLILLVCGALLLTPGFFTDAVGFLLLVPSVRQTVATYLLQRGVARGVNGNPFQNGRPGPSSAPGQDDIIEGEYRRKDDDRHLS